MTRHYPKAIALVVALLATAMRAQSASAAVDPYQHIATSVSQTAAGTEIVPARLAVTRLRLAARQHVTRRQRGDFEANPVA